MKLALPLVLALGLVATAQAQTSPTQEKPAIPKTEPRSANPEDAHTSTTGEADKKTFQAGSKRDASAGCSTPTDAKSAGVDTRNDPAVRKRSDGTRTVCTTSGSEGVGAVDKSKKDQPKEKNTQSSSAAERSSTSPKPR
jgi:hypothetical protein